MFDWFLDTLQISGVAVASNFGLRSPIDGLESPDYRVTSYNLSGEDGGFVSNALYGMRQVNLVGYIRGSSVTDFENKRQLFSRAAAIKRDALGIPQLTLNRFTTLAGISYYFYAQPGKPVFHYEQINFCEFMLPLTVPQPQIYLSTTIDSGQIRLPSASGVTFPLTFPVTFGGVAGGSATVNNQGSIFTWPVITLSGQLTNPYIFNATTGKIMQLNYTLNGGDQIQIYMGDTVDPAGTRQLGKRIMLNGQSSLVGSKTNESSWWALEPNDNVITINTSNTGDTGTIRVTAPPAVVGV